MVGAPKGSKGLSSRGSEGFARLGVLALQGDFEAHLSMLASCGFQSFAVRSPLDLERAEALIVPGGESTAMLKLIDRFGLRNALTQRIQGGMPAFGTCAGAIVLAGSVSDGEPPLGVLPIQVERNAYGRQVDSFEADIDVTPLQRIVRGVFIRAPVITEAAEAVQVMAWWREHPVLVRYGRILASTFHPELTPDATIHRYFVEQLCAMSFGTDVSEELAAVGEGL